MIQAHSDTPVARAVRHGFQYTRWMPLLALALLGSVPAPAPGAQDDARLEAQRTLYGQALHALRHGRAKHFRQQLQQLDAYPLKPYLEYRYLVARLRGSHDRKIAGFIAAHEGSHLSRRLRRAWLPALFKRRQYAQLIAAYKPHENPSLDCLYVRAHIRLKKPTEPLQHAIHAIWLHGKSRPKICDPLFHWLRKRGLNKELVWQRIQLSMEQRNTRLARYLKRFLPARERAWVDLWIKMHRHPRRHLRDPRLKSRERHLQMIAAHGITRLSRKHPGAAHQWLQEFVRADLFEASWIQELQYRIAFSAGRVGHPQARFMMEAIPIARRDDDFRFLRLRLALRERDWQRVLHAAQELPAGHTEAQMSEYWQARALERLGNADASRSKYVELAKTRGYYGFLAAERLGRPYAMNHQAMALTAPQRHLAERTAAVARAREFHYHGDVRNARQEWNDLLAMDNPDLSSYAAVLAGRWGWHEGAIRGFGHARNFDDLRLRFPKPHLELFEAHTRRNHIDPTLALAVARRESAFVADTRSSAGAIGLMQLMPSTARAVARSIGLKRPRTRDLKDPNLNIRLGSRYLADMLKRYKGNVAMALAAYNAGPGAVDRWRPKAAIDADLWIDSIPYRETRKYVRATLEYAAIYRWLTGRPAQRLKPQIHPIQLAPRSTRR